jgi:hypothetical protein
MGQRGKGTLATVKNLFPGKCTSLILHELTAYSQVCGRRKGVPSRYKGIRD